MKRILLFIGTNLAVIVLLNITMRILGVDRILDAQGGLDLNALLIFAAVIGFGGAFFSLAISKWSAKRMTGARVIEHEGVSGTAFAVWAPAARRVSVVGERPYR